MSWIGWVIIGILCANALFVLVLWLRMKMEDRRERHDQPK